ncbi:MAG: MlaD family protein [Caulobacteraceae bacterium]|nr:MlaD family protein [Caulobacteraceae bacterium]
MERNANYALVGFSTLILFIGLVVFVVWLARVSYGREYDLYDILFVGPVQGLSQGGDVDFNGIKVGEVTRIALDRTDPSRVIARARVTSDVPIRTDSYATLEPQGVTGVDYVQITAGNSKNPLLKDTVPHGEVPVIHTRPGVLSSLLQGSGTILAAAAQALDRINRLLSDQNLKNISGAIGDVHAITAEARGRKQLFADADQAIKNIDEAAVSIKQLSDSSSQLVNGDGRRSLRDIADAAGQIKDAASDARALVKRLEGPTTDFATTGLPQLTQAVASLQQAADSLNRLAAEAEQSPQALVTKAPAKEVQVKP